MSFVADEIDRSRANLNEAKACLGDAHALLQRAITEVEVERASKNWDTAIRVAKTFGIRPPRPTGRNAAAETA